MGRKDKSGLPSHPSPTPLRRFERTSSSFFKPTLHDSAAHKIRNQILKELIRFREELQLINSNISNHKRHELLAKDHKKEIIQKTGEILLLLTTRAEQLHLAIEHTVDTHHLAKQNDSEPKSDYLNRLIENLSQQKERSLHAKQLVGFSTFQPLLEKLTPEITQQIAQRLVQLPFINRGDEVIDHKNKQALQEYLQQIFIEYHVNILNSGNNTVVKFSHKLVDFHFILRTSRYAQEELFEKTSSIDARLALFDAFRHGKQDIFNLLTEQFYSTDISPCASASASAAASASASDNSTSDKGKDEFEGMPLSDILGDDILFLDFDEYIDGSDLEKHYEQLRTKSNPGQLIAKAFSDITVLSNLFYKMIKSGVCYTDIKPQNIFYVKSDTLPFKISDMKSLQILPEAEADKISIYRSEFTKGYSDYRVNNNDYKPELALKIAMISCMYQFLTGNVPEIGFTEDDIPKQTLEFDWENSLFKIILPGSTSEEVNGLSIGNFLQKHYESDDSSITDFITELAFHNTKIYKQTADEKVKPAEGPSM